MKKLAVLLFLALSFPATAQFSKGTVFLGGTLSTIFQNSDNNTPVNQIPNSQTTSNFGISPSVGFFLSEKMAVGAALNYSAQRSDYHQANGYYSKSSLISIGNNPYLRLYQPITGSIYFGLQGSVGFSRGNFKQTTTNGIAEMVTEIPSYSLTASVKPLFIFFPSPKWGIETSIGSLGYSYSRNLPDASSSTSFGMTAGSFSFGVAYYFIKK
jgi:hypothetical protein